MKLPVMPPVSPMLAKLSRDLPTGPGLYYEPKWDGFRCIVFRDGHEVELESRNERPLTRYFPELIEPLRRSLPKRCVVDGEVVIAGANGLEFDALLQRIHPADSRVQMLASTTPASFVAFDLLASGDEDLCGRPYRERRAALERDLSGAEAPIYVTPVTQDPALAADWFERFEGAGLDGVVAKAGDGTYRPGERTMIKIKHERTADCVVGGFRWHKAGGIVGSLLLGLFDDKGTLHHVGVTSSFSNVRRRELVDELAPYRIADLEGHPWQWQVPEEQSGRIPGSPSRWTAKRDLSWEPLRPELVCEVAFDHLQGDRFRHAATFKRWRPDRRIDSCTYAQLDAVAPAELEALFAVS